MFPSPGYPPYQSLFEIGMTMYLRYKIEKRLRAVHIDSIWLEGKIICRGNDNFSEAKLLRISC